MPGGSYTQGQAPHHEWPSHLNWLPVISELTWKLSFFTHGPGGHSTYPLIELKILTYSSSDRFILGRRGYHLESKFISIADSHCVWFLLFGKPVEQYVYYIPPDGNICWMTTGKRSRLCETGSLAIAKKKCQPIRRQTWESFQFVQILQIHIPYDTSPPLGIQQWINPQRIPNATVY